MKVRLIEGPLAVPRYRQVRLPTVAAELAPYAEVEINDPNIEPLDTSRVDLVGFTAQAYNAPRAIYLAERFKERGVKTIVGGPYATTMREKALEHFDAAVVGELEGLGERIISDLEGGRLGGIYENEQPPDLAQANLPRRDLQDAGAYYRINYPIEFTRGCPHRCNFCYGRFGFPTFRTRPLDDIAEDLDNWDYGYVEAVDLHFAADREHIIEVCRLLEERKVWGWFGEATLKSMDDADLLKALERSNCKSVFVGIESIEPSALKASNKQFNRTDDYRRIIHMMQDHGILVHAGLMWGLDGASKDTFEATARWCEENNIYLASTNIVAFYPDLPQHELMKESGRIKAEDLRDYDSVRVTIEPEGLTEQEIYEGARRFNDRFYSFYSIFRRSFQSATFNLSQLSGFWGMNLAYRAYFEMWGRQLGRKVVPWPASPEARESFPYVGGEMPLTYRIGHWEIRLLDWLHRAWVKPAQPARGSLSLAVLIALFCLRGVYDAGTFGATHWPVPWPSFWLAIGIFVGATVISTWLITRLTRSMPPRGPGGRPPTSLASLWLLVFALVPMGCAVYLVPETYSALRFLLAAYTVLLAAKAWSVFVADGACRNPFRVVVFLWFYPTLMFESAFVLDPIKAPLSRHYALLFVGSLRIFAGGILGIILWIAIVGGYVPSSWSPITGLLRLIAIYLFLRGSLEYGTAYWRMVGCSIPRPFEAAALCPSAIWRSLNTTFHRWLVEVVYRPLGGKRRPLLATMATFLVSVTFFLLPIYCALFEVPLVLIGLFLFQGVLVVIEKRFFSNRRAIARLLGAFAITALIVSSPWIVEVIDVIAI